MSDNPPNLSVIIVTHNSLPALTSCLVALEKAARTDPLQLLLVDNGSDDGSPEATLDIFPNAKVIVNERNLGFAAACNQGAGEADGEYLLFVNPDVVIDEGAIEQLLGACTENQQAGLACGRLRFPDGSFQATCRNFPNPTNLLFSRGSFMTSLIGRSFDSRARYTLPDSIETTEVSAVAATMTMIKRSRFEKVGGFDPRFFMFMEDTDLSLRLNRSGYANLFVPAAGGIHDWGRGSRVGRLRRLWHHHNSLWKYFLKHYPNGFSVLALPPLLVLNFCVMLLLPTRQTARGK